MTDTTNVTPVTPSADFLQQIEAYASRLEGGLVKDLEALDAWLAKEYAEYAPYMKAFFLLLFQQETNDAITAGIAAVPTGNPSAILAAVGAAVVGSIGANAAADAQTEVAAAQANAATD